MNLSAKLIFYIYISAFLTLCSQRCSLRSHCINNSEQQMFSMLAGFWQHINWQFIGDPQNLEKLKKNDIEGQPVPPSLNKMMVRA